MLLTSRGRKKKNQKALSEERYGRSCQRSVTYHECIHVKSCLTLVLPVNMLQGAKGAVDDKGKTYMWVYIIPYLTVNMCIVNVNECIMMHVVTLLK